MGSNLSFVMPLLRCLNQSEDLRMNYRLLCKRLEVTVEVLQEIAVLVNEMEPLLYQDGEDLVLVKKLDLINAKNIHEKVSTRGRFVLKDVTPSTNGELMNARDELVSGDALVAEIQTQGRSLRGTQWLTSIGTNIMLSMAFKFPSHQHLLGFSLAVGVATVNALEFAGVRDVKLKWPNDVVINDKKVAGILIESVPGEGEEIFAIVGVGLNVHHSESIDKLIDRPYTDLDELGYNLTRDEICINLINEIKYAASSFRKHRLAQFLDSWNRHDSLLGRQVEVVISAHRTVVGRVSGVNNLGELILESNAGCTAIRSGHISLIRY